jgi:hypothetical protein
MPYRSVWPDDAAKDAALLPELHKLIGQRMDAGQIAQPSQIVGEIFKKKPLISTPYRR